MSLPMPETIKLSEYDENWAVCFLSEKKQLEHSFKKMCPGNLVDILHIGSTSVKGLLYHRHHFGRKEYQPDWQHTFRRRVSLQGRVQYPNEENVWQALCV